MGSQVIRQVCQLLETASTFVALVWFFARVGVSMDLHVDFLVKPFSTEVTNERLVVGVRAHVGMQVRSTVECLVALRAHVRFDGSVS